MTTVSSHDDVLVLVQTAIKSLTTAEEWLKNTNHFVCRSCRENTTRVQEAKLTTVEQSNEDVELNESKRLPTKRLTRGEDLSFAAVQSGVNGTATIYKNEEVAYSTAVDLHDAHHHSLNSRQSTVVSFGSSFEHDQREREKNGQTISDDTDIVCYDVGFVIDKFDSRGDEDSSAVESFEKPRNRLLKEDEGGILVCDNLKSESSLIKIEDLDVQEINIGSPEANVVGGGSFKVESTHSFSFNPNAQQQEFVIVQKCVDSEEFKESNTKEEEDVLVEKIVTSNSESFLTTSVKSEILYPDCNASVNVDSANVAPMTQTTTVEKKPLGTTVEKDPLSFTNPIHDPVWMKSPQDFWVRIIKFDGIERILRVLKGDNRRQASIVMVFLSHYLIDLATCNVYKIIVIKLFNSYSNLHEKEKKILLDVFLTKVVDIACNNHGYDVVKSIIKDNPHLRLAIFREIGLNICKCASTFFGGQILLYIVEILKQSDGSLQRDCKIIDNILDRSLELSTHKFGRLLLHNVLDSNCCRKFINVIAPEIVNFLQQNNVDSLLEKCLESASSEDLVHLQVVIKNTLDGNNDNFYKLELNEEALLFLKKLSCAVILIKEERINTEANSMFNEETLSDVIPMIPAGRDIPVSYDSFPLVKNPDNPKTIIENATATDRSLAHLILAIKCQFAGLAWLNTAHLKHKLSNPSLGYNWEKVVYELSDAEGLKVEVNQEQRVKRVVTVLRIGAINVATTADTNAMKSRNNAFTKFILKVVTSVYMGVFKDAKSSILRLHLFQSVLSAYPGSVRFDAICDSEKIAKKREFPFVRELLSYRMSRPPGIMIEDKSVKNRIEERISIQFAPPPLPSQDSNRQDIEDRMMAISKAHSQINPSLEKSGRDMWREVTAIHSSGAVEIEFDYETSMVDDEEIGSLFPRCLDPNRRGAQELKPFLKKLGISRYCSILKAFDENVLGENMKPESTFCEDEIQTSFHLTQSVLSKDLFAELVKAFEKAVVKESEENATRLRVARLLPASVEINPDMVETLMKIKEEIGDESYDEAMQWILKVFEIEAKKSEDRLEPHVFLFRILKEILKQKATARKSGDFEVNMRKLLCKYMSSLRIDQKFEKANLIGKRTQIKSTSLVDIKEERCPASKRKHGTLNSPTRRKRSASSSSPRRRESSRYEHSSIKKASADSSKSPRHYESAGSSYRSERSPSRSYRESRSDVSSSSGRHRKNSARSPTSPNKYRRDGRSAS